MDSLQSQTTPICRLCLGTTPSADMTLLNCNEHLVESIRQLTTVEALMVDPLYAIYMCTSCQETLEQCIRFRNTCLQNDGTFRQRYQHGVVKVEPDEAVGTFTEVKIEMIVTPDVVEDAPANEWNDIRDEGESDEWELPSPEVSEKVPKKRKEEVAAKKEAPKSDEIPMAQCQVCGKVMKKTGLTAHLGRHKPNRTEYVCQYCQKVFYNSLKLKNHVNGVHTHMYKYACDVCGKTYERTDTLRVHYRAKHTDEKPYECKVCGMRFARDDGRRYHFQKVHQVGKPHECEFCDKAFRRKAEHTLHMRTHTGEKPFNCDICGKAFSKSYNVVIHKKSHQNQAERAAANVAKTGVL
ncbi:hypothetical protein quinque_015031 [Culex quinquefasciatus]